ncbi:hypothetical protein Holit_02857 [Hollandina sp. SP2]
MQTEKIKVVLSIILKISLIIIVIFLNYIFSKHYDFNTSQSPSVIIIGGPDGPTTIYISSNYHWINALKYFLSVIFIIDNIILIILDIKSIRKEKKYDLKYILKIILAIDLYLIIIGIMIFGIKVFGTIWIAISILLNLLLGTLFFIKNIFMKIIQIN